MLRFLTGLNCTIALATGAALTPAWVLVGDDGAVVVRIVVAKETECPSISINKGQPVPMQVRQPIPQAFPPACEFSLPSNTRSAKVDGQKLAIPKPDPSRIIVIGDTGCRMKGERAQACNDPDAWPFERVAKAAALRKPDLVLHAGDVLYREDPCPAKEAALCLGSPSGDTWAAWNADFFAPAAELLKAAPWLMTRGNHESCKRTWKGWFYYLDPRPMPSACVEYSAPFLAKLGSFKTLVLDSSEAVEKLDTAQLAIFRNQLKPYAAENTWLLLHHPVWGLKTDPKADASPMTEMLKRAVEEAGMKNIGLIIAGHVHMFAMFSFSNGWPPQLIAGDAGTLLAAKTDRNAGKRPIYGNTLTDSKFVHEFGFVEMRGAAEKWTIRLRNQKGKKMAACELSGKTAVCD